MLRVLAGESGSSISRVRGFLDDFAVRRRGDDRDMAEADFHNTDGEANGDGVTVSGYTDDARAQAPLPERPYQHVTAQPYCRSPNPILLFGSAFVFQLAIPPKSS
jgi:hypothetical protein